jgi:hypothetical protein
VDFIDVPPDRGEFERVAIDDLDLRPAFTPLTAAIFFANGSASQKFQE